MKQKNRVYGVVGISSIMANFNADFSGYPKTNSDDKVFGSDKALKYPIKKMWEQKGEKVLYIKSMKFSESEEKNGEKRISLVPRSLAERYEYIFGEEVNKGGKNVDNKNVLTNLFRAIDVKNFGATFAEAGNNIAITGAVQIGQGFNFYSEHQAFDQPILSPFRDATEKKGKKDGNEDEKQEAKNSTIGTKILSNEAHYFFPFTVNPKAYDNYAEMGVTEGYLQEDYQKLKEALLCASTAFDTNSKAGCDNEFAIFVETEEDCYLPNLDGYILFEKGEEKNCITLNCGDILNDMGDKIKKVEVYFNPYHTEIKHTIQNAKVYHIVTRKEV